MLIAANSSIRLVTVNQTKSRHLQEKIKTIRKTIKKVNMIDKDDEPLLYKSTWKKVYDLTTDLRKDMDEYIDDDN
jgi:hypothetical protein